MYLDIRAGNEGFVDRPLMRLDPGGEQFFLDHGTYPGTSEDARFIHIHCSEDPPCGTVLIVPATPDVLDRLADGEDLAQVSKETELHIVDEEPQTLRVNNPDRGLKSARLILKFVA